MGPDGRHQDGAAYIRTLFQMGMWIERGTYPMRPELGSTLPERIGDPMNPEFSGNMLRSIAETFEQIGGGVRLDRVRLDPSPRGMTANVHILQLFDGSRVNLEGVEIR